MLSEQDGSTQWQKESSGPEVDAFKSAKIGVICGSLICMRRIGRIGLMVLFAFPRNAEFEWVIPKTKFYERAKPFPVLKLKFLSEIVHAVWNYKLAQSLHPAHSEWLR